MSDFTLRGCIYKGTLRSLDRNIKKPILVLETPITLMHGSILPVTIPPPGNPRDKSSPSGPGVGNCLKRFCPGGRGVGQIENNFSFFLLSTSLAYHFSVDTMAPDCVEKTGYFQGKFLEFVADWLEKNILSKFKSVFKGTFIINC